MSLLRLVINVSHKCFLNDWKICGLSLGLRPASTLFSCKPSLCLDEVKDTVENELDIHSSVFLPVYSNHGPQVNADSSIFTDNQKAILSKWFASYDHMFPFPSSKVKREKVDTAFTKYCDLVGDNLTIDAYNSFLLTYIENGWIICPKIAIRWLDDSNLRPNETTIFYLLWCCCLSPSFNLEDVRSIESLSETVNIMPDESMLTIATCFNARTQDSTPDLYRLLQSHLKFLQEQNIEPTRRGTFLPFAHQCCSLGDTRSLIQVLVLSEHFSYLSDSDLLGLIVTLVRNNYSDKIDKVLSLVERRGHSYDWLAHNTALQLLVDGHYESAHKVLFSQLTELERFGEFWLTKADRFMRALLFSKAPTEVILNYGRQFGVNAVTGVHALDTALYLSYFSRQYEYSEAILYALAAESWRLKAWHFWPLLTKATGKNVEEMVRMLTLAQKCAVDLTEISDVLVSERLSTAGITFADIIKEAEKQNCKFVCLSASYLKHFLECRDVGSIVEIVRRLDKHSEEWSTFEVNDVWTKLIDFYKATKNSDVTTDVMKLLNTVEFRHGGERVFYRTDYSGNMLYYAGKYFGEEELRTLISKMVVKELLVSIESMYVIRAYFPRKLQLSTELSNAMRPLLLKRDIDHWRGKRLSVETSLDNMERKFEIKKAEGKETFLTFKSLLAKYCKTLMKEKAEKLVEEAAELGHHLGNGGMWLMFSMYLRLQDAEKAMPYIKHIFLSGNECNLIHMKGAIYDVILLLARQKMFDEIRQVLRGFDATRRSIISERFSADFDNKQESCTTQSCSGSKLGRKQELLRHELINGSMFFGERFISTFAKLFVWHFDEALSLLKLVYELELARPSLDVLCIPVRRAIVKGNLQQAVDMYCTFCDVYALSVADLDLYAAVLKSNELELLDKAMGYVQNEDVEKAASLLKVTCGYLLDLEKQLTPAIVDPRIAERNKSFFKFCVERLSNSDKESALTSLLQAVRSSEGVYALDLIYANLIKIYKKKSDWSKALDCWTQAKEKLVDLDIVTMRELATLLEANGQSVPFTLPSMSPADVDTKMTTERVTRIPELQYADAMVTESVDDIMKFVFDPLLIDSINRSYERASAIMFQRGLVDNALAILRKYLIDWALPMNAYFINHILDNLLTQKQIDVIRRLQECVTFNQTLVDSVESKIALLEFDRGNYEEALNTISKRYSEVERVELDPKAACFRSFLRAPINSCLVTDACVVANQFYRFGEWEALMLDSKFAEAGEIEQVHPVILGFSSYYLMMTFFQKAVDLKNVECLRRVLRMLKDVDALPLKINVAYSALAGAIAKTGDYSAAADVLEEAMRKGHLLRVMGRPGILDDPYGVFRAAGRPIPTFNKELMEDYCRFSKPDSLEQEVCREEAAN